MQNELKFSLDTMRRCSGNAIGDQAYAVRFCREAIERAQDAADKLGSMADLMDWNDNIRGTSESLLGLINALYHSIKDFVEFFQQKPEMAALFNQVSSRSCACTAWPVPGKSYRPMVAPASTLLAG